MCVMAARPPTAMDAHPWQSNVQNRVTQDLSTRAECFCKNNQRWVIQVQNVQMEAKIFFPPTI